MDRDTIGLSGAEAMPQNMEQQNLKAARNYEKAQAVCRPATLEEEKRKSAQYHWSEAQKAEAGADFLRRHPEFDEFIRLIRSGSISI